MNRRKQLAALPLALAMGATSAAAQQASNQENQPIQAGEIIAMADWRNEDLYTRGMSVDEIFDDVDVYGAEGEEIGDVENIVFSRDGEALSLIAEVGGFWDIGDTHVNVPWEEVRFEDGNFVIPVTADTVDDYNVFRTNYLLASEAGDMTQVVDDDLATGPNAFRATDLMGDYARIRDGDGYANFGYVQDLIIRDGRLAAVVVRPDAAGGYGVTGAPYAYPWYGQGWGAGRPYYDMPYGREDVSGARPFDYERIETD